MPSFSSKDLAQEQLEIIAQQPKKLKQARPVQPDKQAARTYNAQLQKLIRAIRKDVQEQILPMVRNLEPQYIGDSAIKDAWPDDIMTLFAGLRKKWGSPEFLNASKGVASLFINSMNVNNRRRFTNSVKSIGVTGIDVFGDSSKLQDILSAAIAQNTQLITKMSDDYLNQIQTIVTGNMRAGLRPSAIVKQLSEQFGISQRRAALIARDQTSKASGELSKQRQEDAGFEYFKWRTSEDIRVRDDHDNISDKDIGYGRGVYRWDDPPKNKKGVPTIPGQDINCRCVAIPITGRQVAETKVKD